MNKSDIVLWGIVVFLIVFVVYCGIAMWGAGEDIILEGEVTNVEIIKNADETDIEYYLIYMNDEPTPYKILPSDDIDFTVNSKIVIRLGKVNPRLPIFSCPDAYTINSIVKIP